MESKTDGSIKRDWNTLGISNKTALNIINSKSEVKQQKKIKKITEKTEQIWGY